MTRHLTFCLFLVLAAASSLHGFQTSPILPDTAAPRAYKPMHTTVEYLGSIPPVRNLTPHTQAPAERRVKTWQKRNYFKANALNNPHPLPTDGDPLAKQQLAERSLDGPEVVPGLNFEGMRDGNVTPPDPTGDVGKDHYVQMINSSGGAWFQVWDKQGNSVYGPALSSTIWNQVNSGSIGDPIIQYDPGAERWLMMEMQGFQENQLLIAISDDSDPLGSWKAYRIQCLGFPDYPKLYVWHNAYFVTVNEIVSSNQCVGYALDRQAMLDGAETLPAWRFRMPNFQAIAYQPATGVDWEGGPPPPPGSPGYIFRVYDDGWDGGQDHLEQWQIFLNWQDTTQNFAFGPTNFNVAPFETRVCFGGGLFNCIEQPDANAPRITALENIIMYRAPYRNFGTHESIVLNHVSDVSNQVGDGGDAAVRWYEFRRNNGDPNWSVYQQGTYAPDLNNRFTGTLSLDEQGNIGLGYTVASTITYPGIRITGRRVSDPLGQMTVQEYTLANGGASHYDERWGDYSNMAVDPVDGKTFWFTSEYQPAGNVNWGSRIGTFQIRRDTFDVSPEALTAPVDGALLGANEQVTVRVVNGGLEPATNVTLRLKVDGTVLATEPLAGTIPSGGSALHTFTPTVGWANVGETHQLEVVSSWVKDQFVRNDTVRATVKKLASFDAALAGRVGLPNLVCTPDYTFGILLKNAAGLPLDSARIVWKLSNQPQQVIHWTGHLLPGQLDTVPIALTGLGGSQNNLQVRTLLPNGQMDQDSTNDKANIKIYTNLQGAFLTAECTTTTGVLRYEIFDGTVSLASGQFTQGAFNQEICSANGTCYTLKLRSTTFNWSGHFRLLDLFGNVLAEVYYASPENTTIPFCTPTRKQSDVGAVALLDPKSGTGLTAAEPVTVAVRNFGLTAQSNIAVSWRLDGGVWQTENLPGPLAAGATQSFTFANSTADLSVLGQPYLFELRATVATDEDTANDTLQVPVVNRAPRDLELQNIDIQACNDTSSINITLKIVNNGLDTLKSLDVLYVFNSVPGTYEVTDLLVPAGVVFDLPLAVTLTGVFGNNTFEADLSNVNGQGEDFFPSNDQRSASFGIQPDGQAVYATLILDDHPEQTRWEIRTPAGEVVASGGPYAEPFAYILEPLCLTTDSCYEFRLYDSGNDGMEGVAQIVRAADSGTLLQFDGSTQGFTSVWSGEFCALNLCGSFQADVTVFPASGPGAANGKILISNATGTPPNQYSLNGGAYGPSSVFSNLLPGVYVVRVRDANGCVYEETVELGTVGTRNPTEGLRHLTVSPNPTRDLVWFAMPAQAGEQEAVAELSDPSGRFLRTCRMTRFDDSLRGIFSLEALPSGTYPVRVRSVEGRVLAVQLIVKQ